MYLGEKCPAEYLFKILVVGDIGTGKTSLIKRYVYNIFSTHYKSTIGVDFGLNLINIKDDMIVRLQLWDIAGQERFGNMTRVYYRDAHAAFVVFDVSRISTYETAAKWKQDIDNKIFTSDGNNIPVILLANKCDLIDLDEVFTTKKEMAAYCKENGFRGWFKTSAKDNIGIDDAAEALINIIMEYTTVSLKEEDKKIMIGVNQSNNDSCC